MTAFGAYTSGSRHREQSFIVTSEGAERAEIAGRPPLGDRREIAASAVLANVTRNLSRQDEKESAISLVCPHLAFKASCAAVDARIIRKNSL